MNKQPKDGDVILHCGHIDNHKSWHWHLVNSKCPPDCNHEDSKAPSGITFKRPDGTTNVAKWIIVCPPCQAFWGMKIMECPIRGDGVWKGSEPVSFSSLMEQP